MKRKSDLLYGIEIPMKEMLYFTVFMFLSIGMYSHRFALFSLHFV